jgi:BirA family biotin operon repressor/biotin-[acetyl-CoA-carboxylase] ligase
MQGEAQVQAEVNANIIRACPILNFDSLDSTNDEALRQLQAGREPPFWVLAREQTGGRGRRNNVWASPPGNLYSSHALRPGVPPPVSAQLSLVAALAAHDAMRPRLPAGARRALRLKWPNDLMLGNAKLGGILLETTSSLHESGGPALIIGIGLNLAIAPHIDGRQTASAGLTPSPGAASTVARALADAFEARRLLWRKGQNFAEIRKEWLARAYRLGETIALDAGGTRLKGILHGLSPEGALELLTQGGEMRHIFAGEVSAPG